MSIGRSDYKHYQNLGEEGDVVFVTTTCLDFVHAFAEPKVRDLMAASLIDDCRRYATELHAFVVMPHHVHFIIRVPKGKTVFSTVQRIKANSARRILPRLDSETNAKFDEQRGLNQRSFWKVSFRAYGCGSVFWQKVRYIHANPVKAQLCMTSEDYAWSSARYIAGGNWCEESGPDLDRMAIEFGCKDHLDFVTRPSTFGNVEG